MNYRGNKPSEEAISKALNDQKLFDLFVGNIGKVYSPYASMPTDDEYVFRSWILFLDQAQNKNELWKLFKEIVEKISLDKEYNWFSIYYLYHFINYLRKTKIIPFNVQDFINAVLTNLINSKKEFEKDFSWVGDEKNNYSKWDDIKRMVQIIKRDSNNSYNFREID